MIGSMRYAMHAEEKNFFFSCKTLTNLLYKLKNFINIKCLFHLLTVQISFQIATEFLFN